MATVVLELRRLGFSVRTAVGDVVEAYLGFKSIEQPPGTLPLPAACPRHFSLPLRVSYGSAACGSTALFLAPSFAV